MCHHPPLPTHPLSLSTTLPSTSPKFPPGTESCTQALPVVPAFPVSLSTSSSHYLLLHRSASLFPVASISISLFTFTPYSLILPSHCVLRFPPYIRSSLFDFVRYVKTRQTQIIPQPLDPRSLRLNFLSLSHSVVPFSQPVLIRASGIATHYFSNNHSAVIPSQPFPRALRRPRSILERVVRVRRIF